MAIDNETLELLERRLAENVEARVRARLFKYYGSVGAVALTVLGFFGYNIVKGIDDSAKEYARKAVAPALESTLAATGQAEETTRKMNSRLASLEEAHVERLKVLAQSALKVTEARATMEALSGEIDGRIRGIKDDIVNTEAQLKAQGERFSGKEVAGLDYVRTLEGSLGSLASQVGILEQQLREIREKAMSQGIAYRSPEVNQDKIAGIAKLQEEKAPVAAVPEERTRVYFQFAGVDRSIAKAISGDLKDQDFRIPGEERTGVAAGLHEVWYFHDGDVDRARKLVTAVNISLANRGLKANVETADFRAYKGPKPQPGTIELWIEPIPTRN